MSENMETQVSTLLTDILNSYSQSKARNRQTRIGPSAVGYCRRNAYYIATEAVRTPAREGIHTWPADVGTAIHSYIDEAVAWARESFRDHRGFGDWDGNVILGSEYGPITATLPDGDTISGTFDLLLPQFNLVLDVKTVNGMTWTQNKGVSQNHNWQRHLYALGAQQAGLLDDRPMYVGNLYFDRSGKDSIPYAQISEYDPTVIPEIQAWVEDVKYAVIHGEQHAAQDLPAARCRNVCDFYDLCYGVLPETHEEAGPITDEESIEAIDMYVRGRALESEGRKMKQAASVRLVGIAGATDEWQVRWTVVNRDGYAVEPSSYNRLDVTKIRRGVSPGNRK